MKVSSPAEASCLVKPIGQLRMWGANGETEETMPTPKSSPEGEVVAAYGAAIAGGSFPLHPRSTWRCSRAGRATRAT